MTKKGPPQQLHAPLEFPCYGALKERVTVNVLSPLKERQHQARRHSCIKDTATREDWECSLPSSGHPTTHADWNRPGLYVPQDFVWAVRVAWMADSEGGGCVVSISATMRSFGALAMQSGSEDAPHWLLRTD